jgi:cell division protein FtsI/penicillin-binding protein 2
LNTYGERRWRLIHHGLPALAALALIALAVGAYVGAHVMSGPQRAARDYARAWQRGDYGAMDRLLAPASRRRVSEGALRAAYRRTLDTATATGVVVGKPEGEHNGRVSVPVDVHTRLFGTVSGDVEIAVTGDQVVWQPQMTFPGLARGVTLTRRTQPPVRGTLLSRNGKVLARGPANARSSPLGSLSGSIAGSLSRQETPPEREALYARGFPRNWPVGQTGLEQAFEGELAGRPGGELILGGRRVIGRAAPRKAARVRTTIDTRIQQAAVAALAGRFGGIAALDTRTGEVRALAGIAYSAPQPPGSTFKIITTTAALESHLVKLSTNFPVQQAATIDGVQLQNANGESCGGTFESSFAHSCNSVFAPLGVKVGADRLVNAAERYGFNRKPALPAELESTLPPAVDIKTPLDVGSTAIGQGRVLATPLRMASVAQTVAEGGLRLDPTLRPNARPRGSVRVTTRHVAHTLRRLMLDVVAYGTGTAAQINGVKVAGKTGTAELADTRGPNAEQQQGSGSTKESNTDAWFTAFAPAGHPRIAVAVLLVRAGAGGASAAPAAQPVLLAGLKAR